VTVWVTAICLSSTATRSSSAAIRESASGASGIVLADGVVVGRIMKVTDTPRMWTLAYGPHEEPHADARLRADARGRDEFDFAECPLL
jgi:hypothetical protein